MESIVDLLMSHGAAGMFVAAFLAGSFFPFSSEVVMLGLLEAGIDPMALLVWGTAGNVMGGIFNYVVGSFGREEWIVRYTKVSPKKLERGKRYVRRYGAWAGLLAWVPLLGSLVTVALGYLRTNLPLTLLTVALGKYVRYQILVSTWMAAAEL